MFTLKDWFVTSCISSTLSELMIWFLVKEEYRGNDIQLALMYFYWVFIPTVVFVAMFGSNLLNKTR